LQVSQLAGLQQSPSANNMQSPTPIQNCKLERDKRTLIITVEGELILINHIALAGGGEQ
jgi:hypothetical protein